MDPADLHLVQDQFSCSICLEVFNKPVSTPCGHNYCKDCLASYWAASGVSQCPLCKQSFQGVPELRVNNDFRDLLEVFRKTRTDRSVPATSGHGVVTCDLCDPALKHEALKSCLVCLASYCGAHLEPHRSVQALKWHKLIQPTSDLEERVCRKHSRVVEFFCRDDRSSVCAECLRVDHASHHAVSLEDEFDLKRTTAKTLQQQLQHTLVLKGSTAEEVQTSVVQGRRDGKKTKAEVERVFAALASRGAQLVQALEEKQEAMERRAQALSLQLQLEIADHQRAKTELEELWTTEDDFRLLGELPSVSTSDSAARVPPPLNLHGVRSAVARMADVDRRTLIFSFQKCAFTVTQTSMFGMKAFTGTRPNSRIYPLFRPTAGGKHALRISPVRTTKE